LQKKPKCFSCWHYKTIFHVMYIWRIFFWKLAIVTAFLVVLKSTLLKKIIAKNCTITYQLSLSCLWKIPLQKCCTKKQNKQI
jgi:hypothetical protein